MAFSQRIICGFASCDDKSEVETSQIPDTFFPVEAGPVGVVSLTRHDREPSILVSASACPAESAPLALPFVDAVASGRPLSLSGR